MTYVAADDRYDQMQLQPLRRRAASRCPPISLGLWHNFGGIDPFETGRAIVRRAFDLGVTHFDLANNYGPPYGSAEENFGRLLRDDLRALPRRADHLDEGGLRHVARPVRRRRLAQVPARQPRPEPRSGWGSTTSTSSTRTGSTPTTPLEETMGALDSAVRQGKALYVGISSYSAEKTREAAAILRELGTPLLIHQPSYSLLNRWIEPDLLDALGELGVGCITFSPLAQGVLTDRYLNGIPEGSRASRDDSLAPSAITEETLAQGAGAERDRRRRGGQSLAQMALAWTLRDARVTSTLVGASSVAQLEQNLARARAPRVLAGRARRDRPSIAVLGGGRGGRSAPSLSPGRGRPA